MSDLFCEIPDSVNTGDDDVWASSGALTDIFTSEQCLLTNSKFISIVDNLCTTPDSTDNFTSEQCLLVNSKTYQQLPNSDILREIGCGDVFPNDHLQSLQDSDLLSLPDNYVLFDQLTNAESDAAQDQVQAVQQHSPLQQQQQHYERKPDELVDRSPYSDVAQAQGGQLVHQNQLLHVDVKFSSSLQCTQLPSAAVQIGQLMSPYSVDGESPKDKSKAVGKTRRRKATQHKVKLYQRTEPFSDEEEEKKRRNAVKAFKNRQKKSMSIKQLTDENDELKRQLQEKEAIIQEQQGTIRALMNTKDTTENNLKKIKYELSKVIGTMALS